MTGVPLGVIVEGLVSILLLLTIGYSILLNERLKRLHTDREALKQIVGDLLQATETANTAIRELRETANEAELTLTGRLEEAERFAVELANHVTSGQAVMERISQILAAAREAHANDAEISAAPVITSRAQEALRRLRSHQMHKGEAA